MDYERILDESLLPAYERLKNGLLRLIDEGKISREDAARLLPEIRESYDERVRKNIVATIEQCPDDFLSPKNRDRMLAWLEKQKEHKPVECSEVELEFRGEKVTVKRPFYRDDKGRGYSTAELDEGVAWNALRAWCEKKGISLYDLYPKAKWSEEDEKMIDAMIDIVSGSFYEPLCPRKEMLAWLKSLCPSWKPSEELLDALDIVANLPELEYYGGIKDKIRELYKQLKKRYESTR